MRRWIDENDPLERLSRVEGRNVYRTLPGDKYTNSAIFRIDFPLIGGIRTDLPYVTTNVSGERESGFGDLLVQKIYVLGQKDRWTWGGGLQMIFPTAEKAPFGRGRYLAAPTRLVPGTRMPVAVPDAAQRAAIVAYLARRR